MRYAVVERGEYPRKVVNVIEAEPGFSVEGCDLYLSAVAAPGWTYDGSFHPPVDEGLTPPADIHIAWLRAALAEAGVLDAVNAAVASQGAVKAALWDYATTISLADPDVVAIAGALSIDLDAIFLRADAIRRERGM